MSQGYKRTSTLSAFTGLTAAPPSVDFFIDGDHAEILLEIFDIAGTAPTIQAIVRELGGNTYNLAYDAQTSNFTVGATVIGLQSRAVGLIVDDIDAGTTGTLVLALVSGNFLNNEIIVDDNGTPGSATVNGKATPNYIVLGTWADTTAVAVSARELIVDPDATAGYKEVRPIVPRNFRLSFTAGGTITNLDGAVHLVQSNNN